MLRRPFLALWRPVRCRFITAILYTEAGPTVLSDADAATSYVTWQPQPIQSRTRIGRGNSKQPFWCLEKTTSTISKTMLPNGSTGITLTSLRSHGDSIASEPIHEIYKLMAFSIYAYSCSAQTINAHGEGRNTTILFIITVLYFFNLQLYFIFFYFKSIDWNLAQRMFDW